MEQLETADITIDEYMTMDADEWSELDVYENGGTPDVGFNGTEDSSKHQSGPDSKGQKREELKKEKAVIDKPRQNNKNTTTAPPSIPLTDRYITIRWPPTKAKRRLQVFKSAFSKITTVGLFLLCILLLGGLLFMICKNYAILLELKMQQESMKRNLSHTPI
ncbi:hypothetical protein PBY51_017978 [Eleginops maclovinus]|uniref:Uncharacterized protein n=1 Tax=Eleginops maclovinus TaxID=56733 RepID=A0AAN8AH94_ELEMC|nr:hypothetical protein PBY51_017978 [Eleginops maclovinus]